MPPKLPAENKLAAEPKKEAEKAYAVKQVWFSKMLKLPGYPGACEVVEVGEAEVGIGVNKHSVKSLVIVGDKLIIDKDFFMPLNGGVITGWKY